MVVRVAEKIKPGEGDACTVQKFIRICREERKTKLIFEWKPERNFSILWKNKYYREK